MVLPKMACNPTAATQRKFIGMHSSFAKAVGFVLALLFPFHVAFSAQGEMGTGVPNFGIYSAAMTSEVKVWTLANATVPFPNSCFSLTLSPATMGLDYFKMSVSLLGAAALSNRSIRFYAHAPRDGGCGVDYVELVK